MKEAGSTAYVECMEKDWSAALPIGGRIAVMTWPNPAPDVRYMVERIVYGVLEAERHPTDRPANP